MSDNLKLWDLTHWLNNLISRNPVTAVIVEDSGLITHMKMNFPDTKETKLLHFHMSGAISKFYGGSDTNSRLPEEWVHNPQSTGLGVGILLGNQNGEEVDAFVICFDQDAKEKPEQYLEIQHQNMVFGETQEERLESYQDEIELIDYDSAILHQLDDPEKIQESWSKVLMGKFLWFNKNNPSAGILSFDQLPTPENVESCNAKRFFISDNSSVVARNHIPQRFIPPITKVRVDVDTQNMSFNGYVSHVHEVYVEFAEIEGEFNLFSYAFLTDEERTPTYLREYSVQVVESDVVNL